MEMGPGRPWAPKEFAKRLLADGEEVMYIDRGDSGEFFRGAVKVD